MTASRSLRPMSEKLYILSFILFITNQFAPFFQKNVSHEQINYPVISNFFS